MFRAFVFGVLVTIIVALVGGYFVLRNGIIPANADATPSWLETWAAGTSLDATLRREAQDTNPVVLTDDNLIAAIKLYGQHCAICHGTAKGDPSSSPVAKGAISEASTTGVRRRGRRSRSFLFLEDQARHPVDRNAVMEADVAAA
jgi:mono/diheme cytochrome c family protein